MVGLDVGSTTVKAVVVNPADDKILWRDYQRHDTKQPEKVLEFLKRMEEEVGIVAGHTPHFRHRQRRRRHRPADRRQVRAGSERRGPGGREALPAVRLGRSSWAARTPRSSSSRKIPNTGRKKKIPSMNDKCAGGTGAVIDKINAKLRIPAEQLCEMGYDGHEAASGGRQVRRLRRNRHQRPAEERRARRRADGFALRSHRAAEPGRAHARQYAAPAGAAARRPEYLHPAA